MSTVWQAGFRLGVLMMSVFSVMFAFPSEGRARERPDVSFVAVTETEAIASPIGFGRFGFDRYNRYRNGNKAVLPRQSEGGPPALNDAEEPVPILAGQGGSFVYQIWQSAASASSTLEYYLFVWGEDHSNGEAPMVAYNFASATEAVNFFTCRYARERTATCAMLMALSISYDVPQTCVFPWVECE